jgi:tricorn protease-like protein
LNGKNVQFVDWDDSGEFAFVYLSSNCDIEHAELALLSVANGTLTTVSPDMRLPETFYRSRIFASEHIYFPYANTGWSSSADFYAVLSNERAYVVDVSQMTVTEVPFEGESTTTFIWSPSRNDLFIGQSNNGGVELFRYNPAEDELNLLMETEGMIRQISPSPNGRYFAYSLVFGNAYVFDLSSGQRHEIIPENKMNSLGFDVMWHPEADWFLLASDITTDTRQVFVVNADTLEIREIGVCGNTYSCFGWLPESDE